MASTTIKLKPWTYNIDPETIPHEVLYSQVARIRARQRKSYTGGVVWGKHNPNTNRCRCAKCIAKREKANH